MKMIGSMGDFLRSLPDFRHHFLIHSVPFFNPIEIAEGLLGGKDGVYADLFRRMDVRGDLHGQIFLPAFKSPDIGVSLIDGFQIVSIFLGDLSDAGHGVVHCEMEVLPPRSAMFSDTVIEPFTCFPSISMAS